MQGVTGDTTHAPPCEKLLQRISHLRLHC